MIDALLFDLDGVIADTAKLHYEAWKMIADELDIPFDEYFNEKLKGVDRTSSLNLILDIKNITLPTSQFESLLDRKNDYYVSLLDEIDENDVLPGVLKFIKDARKNNIKIAIASASRNAPAIIEKVGLSEYIDFIADPLVAVHSKPHPAIFLEAARGVNVDINNCIGIEDSQAGIDAINSSGAHSIGIGIMLKDCDLLLPSTANLELNNVMELFK